MCDKLTWSGWSTGKILVAPPLPLPSSLPSSLSSPLPSLVDNFGKVALASDSTVLETSFSGSQPSSESEEEEDDDDDEERKEIRTWQGQFPFLWSKRRILFGPEVTKSSCLSSICRVLFLLLMSMSIFIYLLPPSLFFFALC